MSVNYAPESEPVLRRACRSAISPAASGGSQDQLEEAVYDRDGGDLQRPRPVRGRDGRGRHRCLRSPGGLQEPEA